MWVVPHTVKVDTLYRTAELNSNTANNIEYRETTVLLTEQRSGGELRDASPNSVFNDQPKEEITGIQNTDLGHTRTEQDYPTSQQPKTRPTCNNAGESGFFCVVVRMVVSKGSDQPMSYRTQPATPFPCNERSSQPWRSGETCGINIMHKL